MVMAKKDDLSVVPGEDSHPTIPSFSEGPVSTAGGPTQAPVGKTDTLPHCINKKNGQNLSTDATNENRTH